MASNTETRASVRGVRLSVDKGRLVADLVRGKPVGEALDILSFTPKKAAGIVRKAEEERASGARFDSPFAEITDEDIDSLFSE